MYASKMWWLVNLNTSWIARHSSTVLKHKYHVFALLWIDIPLMMGNNQESKNNSHMIQKHLTYSWQRSNPSTNNSGWWYTPASTEIWISSQTYSNQLPLLWLYLTSLKLTCQNTLTCPCALKYNIFLASALTVYFTILKLTCQNTQTRSCA